MFFLYRRSKFTLSPVCHLAAVIGHQLLKHSGFFCIEQGGGPAENFVSAMSNKQHTRAALAAGTAIHALAFTVIVADAPAKHTIRMLYPWSTLTDGGLHTVHLTEMKYVDVTFR